MPLLAGFLGWFGATASPWIFQKFLPMIAKRLGLGAIFGVIQKAFAAIVVTGVIAFFGFVINFIIQMFGALSNFIIYINNAGGTSSYASCFFRVLNITGIAQGIQMAAPFYLGVIVFFFLYGAYKILHIVVKTVSDESSKAIESTK